MFEFRLTKYGFVFWISISTRTLIHVVIGEQQKSNARIERDEKYEKKMRHMSQNVRDIKIRCQSPMQFMHKLLFQTHIKRKTMQTKKF